MWLWLAALSWPPGRWLSELGSELIGDADFGSGGTALAACLTGARLVNATVAVGDELAATINIATAAPCVDAVFAITLDQEKDDGSQIALMPLRDDQCEGRFAKLVHSPAEQEIACCVSADYGLECAAPTFVLDENSPFEMFKLRHSIGLLIGHVDGSSDGISDGWSSLGDEKVEYVEELSAAFVVARLVVMLTLIAIGLGVIRGYLQRLNGLVRSYPVVMVTVHFASAAVLVCLLAPAVSRLDVLRASAVHQTEHRAVACGLLYAALSVLWSLLLIYIPKETRTVDASSGGLEIGGQRIGFEEDSLRAYLSQFVTPTARKWATRLYLLAFVLQFFAAWSVQEAVRLFVADADVATRLTALGWYVTLALVFLVAFFMPLHDAGKLSAEADAQDGTRPSTLQRAIGFVLGLSDAKPGEEGQGRHLQGCRDAEGTSAAPQPFEPVAASDELVEMLDDPLASMEAKAAASVQQLKHEFGRVQTWFKKAAEQAIASMLELVHDAFNSVDEAGHALTTEFERVHVFILHTLRSILKTSPRALLASGSSAEPSGDAEDQAAFLLEQLDAALPLLGPQAKADVRWAVAQLQAFRASIELAMASTTAAFERTRRRILAVQAEALELQQVVEQRLIGEMRRIGSELVPQMLHLFQDVQVRFL